MGVKYKYGIKDRLKIKDDKVSEQLVKNISPTEEANARIERKMIKADMSIIDRKFDKGKLRFGFNWRKKQYMKIFGHE